MPRRPGTLAGISAFDREPGSDSFRRTRAPARDREDSGTDQRRRQVFSANSGSLETLNVFVRYGFRPLSRQSRHHALPASDRFGHRTRRPVSPVGRRFLSRPANNFRFDRTSLARQATVRRAEHPSAYPPAAVPQNDFAVLLVMFPRARPTGVPSSNSRRALTSSPNRPANQFPVLLTSLNRPPWLTSVTRCTRSGADGIIAAMTQILKLLPKRRSLSTSCADVARRVT